MTSQSNATDSVKPSDPIPISARVRSFSSCSSGSASSGSEVQTPPSPTTGRMGLPSPSNSPILSYFLGHSPKAPSSHLTFPFSRKFGAPSTFEDEIGEKEVLGTAHARRASAVIASRFGQGQSQPYPEQHHERGVGMLRRLSLSTAFSKPLSESTQMRSPITPPNTAVDPAVGSTPFKHETKPRRSATVSSGTGNARPRRAPSPMGERILTGHFDGFN